MDSSPITGWAIKPLMGPASQTKLVSCSERPSESKNGVPYLQCLHSITPYIMQRITTYPSSTVQAICAPAIEILNLTRSQVDIRFRDGSAAPSFAVPSARSLCVEDSGSVRDLSLSVDSTLSRFDCLDGHGICVVGSGSESAAGGGKAMVTGAKQDEREGELYEDGYMQAI